MKLKNTLIPGLAALCLAANASADVVIHITGSSAFRGATHNAILNILNTSGRTYGYTGSTLSGASQAIFKGTTKNGGASVTIKTSFSGSIAGLQTVDQGLNVNFLADNATTSAGGTASLATGTSASVPEIALSDVYASSAPFETPNLVEAGASPVGVIPFKWVASCDAPAGLSNMTPQIAQALFPTGSTKLATFTGSSADEAVNVYALGRDFDSGTRATAFAETGVGNSNPVKQYSPTASGGKVTSQAFWSSYTLLGYSVATGNGGYSSGGTLADMLRNHTTGTGTIGGHYVTYLSTGDANRAITGSGSSNTGASYANAKELTYNGVAYSATAVQEGSYTFWGYEHLSYNTADSGIATVAEDLATQIHDTDATASGILMSSMKVTRNSDGGIVGY